MNESETRAELIDPKLKDSGWGIMEGSKVYREFKITEGKIKSGSIRDKKLTADYVLEFKGIKIAVIEAKSENLDVNEGVAQAKLYAQRLNTETSFASNGREIYRICLKTGDERIVEKFPTPTELWNKTFPEQNNWREKFAEIRFDDKSGSWSPRYYQEVAVNNVMEAIAKDKKRILLTLATGTGKTAIAFQISWKLFHSRWNLNKDGNRRPRILFLADRNILADQAFNDFSSFPDDAKVRIRANEIGNNGNVPTNGNIFFTIFQTFMSGTDSEGKPAPYFGQYPKDYFDFIVIDECHRGGANDESNWRSIMEYFSPAVQLGLTATPKKTDNINTYDYFGEPVYIYSLKEGINDGFLTPFKIKRIKTTIDDYTFTGDDKVLEGDPELGKTFIESDFNKIIEIKERELKRVKILMEDINQNEKGIIFCASQSHAAAIRDLVNQLKENTDTDYCVRVTANDGNLGEQYLREFQDNEKTIPTILTTSHKLSTGVDARNIRNIVLLRPINSMIEFKQIIGRGTRLFEGKSFFTIYDFVDAYKHFSDPKWDGEPIEEVVCDVCGETPCKCEVEPRKPCRVCGRRPCVCEKPPPEKCEICGERPCVCKRKIKIKLRDGKERQIQHMVLVSFLNADGNPISEKEFLENLFGELPKLFRDEVELREIWSDPITRKSLLEKLDQAGFPKEDLLTLQKMVDLEESDLYDVLEYVFNADYNYKTREVRVADGQQQIFQGLENNAKEFIEFILMKYIEVGVDELDLDILPNLLQNKYHSLEDAKEKLGDVSNIRRLFIDFQKYLYMQR